MLQGSENATCLASGNWSSPVPTCIPIQCPPLFLDDPHLSLVELNTSAWGRAVFRCSWGYRLTGMPTIECEPSGRWSGAIPRCRGKFKCLILMILLSFSSITTFKLENCLIYMKQNPHSHCYSYSMYTTDSTVKWSHWWPFGTRKQCTTETLCWIARYI